MNVELYRVAKTIMNTAPGVRVVTFTKRIQTEND